MFKRLLLLATIFLWLPVAPHADTLNVMTSYPQPVVRTFQEAFEAAHPDTQVNILWRRPDDALAVLLKSKTEGVDIVWMPSTTTFSQLAEHQLLQSINIDLTGLPQSIGNMPISDKQQRYLAFELAGYGLFVDTEAVTKAGFPMPQTWEDLTSDVWQGKVALPIPSELGFAPIMIDQLLQAKGWKQGWNTWQAIAANSKLIGSDSLFITDQVRSGRALVGLMVDFFAFTSIQNSKHYQFIYPEQTVFSPAHIGITSSTDKLKLAEVFVKYMLSEQGQSMLLNPDVRRLPVRAMLYDMQHLTANPFTLKTTPIYNYDLGRLRRDYVNMVFNAAITNSHALLVKAWKLLHQLQNDPAFKKQSETLKRYQNILESWPIPEPTIDAPVLQACGAHQSEKTICQQERRRLSKQFARHYQQVIDQLERMRVNQ